FVPALAPRRVIRVPRAPGLRSDLVLLEQRRLRLRPGVNRGVRQVEEERPVLVLLDEPLRFEREPVGEVFPLLRLFETGHLAALVLEGREVAARGAGLVAPDVHVEPEPRRLEALTAEVPLAHERR